MLIVSLDGRALHLTEQSQSSTWEPNAYFAGEPAPQSSELGDSDVARIREAIIAWTGAAPGAGKAATPSRAEHLDALVAQRAISAAEAKRLAPDGAVGDAAWARIRDLAVEPSTEGDELG